MMDSTAWVTVRTLILLFFYLVNEQIYLNNILSWLCKLSVLHSEEEMHRYRLMHMPSISQCAYQMSLLSSFEGLEAIIYVILSARMSYIKSKVLQKMQ